MQKILFIIPVLLSQCLAGPALAAEPTLQDGLSEKLKESDAHTYVSLTVENDSLGSGMDKNYTSGVRLGLLDTRADIPAWLHVLDDVVPTFSINETTTLTYSLGHNLYTPRDIESRTQNPKDRPWAAFLYGSAGLASATDDHVDELEATLGIVGPWALGETIQKNVHAVLGGKDPKGWDNQLKNEPGLILSWQRRWPEFIRRDVGDFAFSAAPHGGVTLGNVYTYGNAGLTLRFGPHMAAWADTPPRVRPAMPGTGYFDVPAGKLGWYLFTGVEGRAVAHNIFLDGNTFASSHGVDKNPLVADVNAGIAFTYNAMQLAYTLNWRSPEFTGEKGSDLFGSVSLGYRF